MTLQRRGDLDGAIAAFRRAYAEQVRLVKARGRQVEYREDLVRSAIELAELLLDRGAPAEEVLGFLSQAENNCERSLQTTPDNPVFEVLLARAQLNRAACLLRRSRAEALEALATADSFFLRLTRSRTRLQRPDPPNIYLRAVVSALKAEAGLKGSHVEDALYHLRSAIERDYTDAERIERDVRLKSLQESQGPLMASLIERCRKRRSGR
jgi:tetratricopeptide (TPR) repeat protein